MSLKTRLGVQAEMALPPVGAVPKTTRRAGGPEKTQKRRGPAMGYRTVLEWAKAGVLVEWVSAVSASQGLLRQERETAVNYIESEAQADVMTCSGRWTRRLEELGAKPTKIVAFKRGDGEMRSYRVPKSWIRRPYGPGSTAKPAPRRSAEGWEAVGVRVQRTTGDLPRSERETAFDFIESERDAEVITCEATWQRRLESQGARPESIQVYDGTQAEHRWYVISKSWLKLPSPRGRR